MILKEAVLPAEKQRIAAFLSEYGLKYEQADQTIYTEDNGKIVSTLSVKDYILKCLAVDPSYRNENLAATLVGEMITRLHAGGIYHYQVFTKPVYAEIFKSFGFSELTKDDKVVSLEGGEGNINDAINEMLVKMKYGLGITSPQQCDTGCVVLNGDPFTNGHLSLVEHAASAHKFVLVFVVEEEGSYFTFKERYAMAYLALKPLSRVLVLPSSKYIVSSSTFPGYFLKTVDETTEEYAKYDATVFEKYFMPALGIKKRYVGEETSDYMRLYNSALKNILKDKLEILPRFEENGQVISAKTVRGLLKEGKIEEALTYIPRNNYAVFKSIINSGHV